jgi:hypothetical protein
VGDWSNENVEKPKGKQFNFHKSVGSFVYEADNTVLDITGGQKGERDHALMEDDPGMEMMGKIRKPGGMRFPQDDE